METEKHFAAFSSPDAHIIIGSGGGPGRQAEESSVQVKFQLGAARGLRWLTVRFVDSLEPRLQDIPREESATLARTP